MADDSYITAVAVMDGEGGVKYGAEVDSGLAQTQNVTLSSHAMVFSDTDLAAALDEESGYNCVRLQDIYGESVSVALTGSVETGKSIIIFWHNQLVIPAGASLTLTEGNNVSVNGGTLQVYGALTIGAQAAVRNGGQVNVGDNGAQAVLTNSGRFEFGDWATAAEPILTVFPGATLKGDGEVKLNGVGVIQNNGGTLEGSWVSEP